MESYINVIDSLNESINNKYLQSLSLNEATTEQKERIGKFIYAGIKKVWQLLLAALKKFGNFLNQLLSNKNGDVILNNDITVLKCVYKFSPMVVANMKLLDKGNINPSTVESVKSFVSKEKENTITLNKGSKLSIKSLVSTCDSYVSALESSSKTSGNTNNQSDDMKKAYDEYSAFIRDIISACNDLQREIISSSSSYNKTKEGDKDEGPFKVNKESVARSINTAISKNNIIGIRLMLKNSLLVDPTFSEFDYMMHLAKDVDELYQQHDLRAFEIDSSKWNDDYLAKEMTRLIYNFSRERLDHVKEIVRKLHPPKK